VGCVWVYIEKVELRYWWVHSDEKNMNKLEFVSFLRLFMVRCLYGDAMLVPFGEAPK